MSCGKAGLNICSVESYKCLIVLGSKELRGQVNALHSGTLCKPLLKIICALAGELYPAGSVGLCVGAWTLIMF